MLFRSITAKSLEEKYKALKEIKRGIAKKEVAKKYGIPLNTLSTWVKSKEKWFMNVRERNVPVSGTL